MSHCTRSAPNVTAFSADLRIKSWSNLQLAWEFYLGSLEVHASQAQCLLSHLKPTSSSVSHNFLIHTHSSTQVAALVSIPSPADFDLGQVTCVGVLLGALFFFFLIFYIVYLYDTNRVSALWAFLIFILFISSRSPIFASFVLFRFVINLGLAYTSWRESLSPSEVTLHSSSIHSGMHFTSVYWVTSVSQALF